MADTPTPAYSVRVRVRMVNEPGMLGKLAIAIGEVGGNISGLRGFEVKTATLDEDVVVNCTSVAHQEQVRAAIEGIEGIEILEFEDRTFHMHEGGKIEVLPLAPVRDIEDLSSPVGAFVREQCIIAPGCREWVDDLYQAWRSWCEREGRTIVSTKQSFGRDLAAAAPGVCCRRGADNRRFYDGIELRRERGVESWGDF